MWNKALSDFWCNVKFSSSFTTEYKETWKENLVIYQKSLKAFLQAPLQLHLNLQFTVITNLVSMNSSLKQIRTLMLVQLLWFTTLETMKKFCLLLRIDTNYWYVRWVSINHDNSLSIPHKNLGSAENKPIQYSMGYKSTLQVWRITSIHLPWLTHQAKLYGEVVKQTLNIHRESRTPLNPVDWQKVQLYSKKKRKKKGKLNETLSAWYLCILNKFVTDILEWA